jgi:hypothetical protein
MAWKGCFTIVFLISNDADQVIITNAADWPTGRGLRSTVKHLLFGDPKVIRPSERDNPQDLVLFALLLAEIRRQIWIAYFYFPFTNTVHINHHGIHPLRVY